MVRINGVSGFLIVYQVLFIVSLPLYIIFFPQSLGLWLATVALVGACGIGVTSLYHRYYSHKTFYLRKFAEPVLLFFGTLALQGSAYTWSHDHRLHHKFLDTEKDPYSIKRGFWHAHFLWLMQPRPDPDPLVVPDLAKNRLVMFQHKHYLTLTIATNALVVFVGGLLFHDIVGAFVLLFLTRVFFNHHTTWFINSLAHTFGTKPYSKEHTAVNNWLISFVTYGEGYHNYHHTFPSDYRNGVCWYQFDPTKVMIWTMAKFGLAEDLRVVDKTLVARTLLVEDKRLVLEKAKNIPYVDWHAVEADITAKADALSRKLAELGNLWSEYRALKMKNARAEAKRIRLRLKELRKSIRVDLRQWSRYCDQMLALPVYVK